MRKFALVGNPNSGKTTLFKTLLGIVKADGGQIYWEGKQVAFLDKEIRSMVGVVLSDSFISGFLQVGDFTNESSRKQDGQMKLPASRTISPHTGQRRGNRRFRIVSFFMFNIYISLFQRNISLKTLFRLEKNVTVLTSKRPR